MVWFARTCIAFLGICLGDASQQASLQQIQSLATSGMESRSAALAAFQKYAEGLIKANEMNSTEVSAEVRDAIKVIMQYVDQMYSELLGYHRLDLSDSECPEAADCESQQLSPAVETMAAHVNATNHSRIAHAACRSELKSHCSAYPFSDERKLDWLNDPSSQFPGPPSLLEKAALVSGSAAPTLTGCGSDYCTKMVDNGEDWCKLYDDFRTTERSDIKNECGGQYTENLADDMINADETTEQGRADLETMESCLVDTEKYIQPLYELYQKCKCRRCKCEHLPATCKSKQHDFEHEFCSKENYRRDTCNGYMGCWNNAWAKCQPGGEVCQRIQINVRGRTADNETGERIRCLLKVLNSTGSREAGLAACVATDYADMNAFWKIECPQNLACPADLADLAIDCANAYSTPCTNDFYQLEYRSKGLDAGFSAASTSYEGQVGECKACTLNRDVDEQSCS